MSKLLLVKTVRVFLHKSGVVKIEAKEFDKFVGDNVLVKVYAL